MRSVRAFDWWLAALCLGLAVTPAIPLQAQDVSVRAYLAPGSTVGVGQSFVVNVEITGAQSLDAQPAAPDLTPFAQYLGSGTQSSMQMAGGRTTLSLTIQYRYQALAEGSFQVPPVTVAAAQRNLRTEALDLTISSEPPPPAAPGGRRADRPDESVVGTDDLFVTVTSSKSSVRDGEPFIVEYRIWTRVDVTSYGFTSVPEPEGFWVENLTPEGSPQVEQRTRNGQQYATAMIRRLALVPTGPGERTIDPIGVEAQVRVRRSNDPFESIFGRSSLFGSTVVPTTVLSNALTIDVDPLPGGQPRPFSGVVGSLEVTSFVDRDSVDANEAVTLTVRVAGEGHVRTVPEPELGLPDDFEVFPPEVSESVRASGSGLAGEKVFEYVLIPRAPGAREIPEIAMGYFDAAAGTYRTVAAPAIPLTVSGTVIEGPTALSRGGVAQLRQDIRFIHLGSASLRPGSGRLVAAPMFWLFALLPMAAFGGALLLRRQRDLLEGDVAYARGRRAGRVAKRRLAEAKRLSETDDVRAFYAEVARALRGLVADRMNLAEAGLQTADLEAQLAARGVRDEVVADVMRCLEHCDRQRFAPPGSDPAEKTRFLQRASDVMTALDRAMQGKS